MACRDKGISDGPMQDVIQKAFDILRNWLCITFGDYILKLSPPAEMISLDRKYDMMSLGIITVMFIVFFGVGPLPLSPILLQLAIDGQAAFAFDKTFLVRLNKHIFHQLQNLEEPLNKLWNLLIESDYLVSAAMHTSLPHAHKLTLSSSLNEQKTRTQMSLDATSMRHGHRSWRRVCWGAVTFFTVLISSTSKRGSSTAMTI